jgi:hypothetical protein
MLQPGRLDLTPEQVAANEAKQAELMAAQRAEALSPDNRWFAGEELKHRPNDTEAVMYYIAHAARDFRRRYNESQQQAEQASA